MLHLDKWNFVKICDHPQILPKIDEDYWRITQKLKDYGIDYDNYYFWPGAAR